MCALHSPPPGIGVNHMGNFARRGGGGGSDHSHPTHSDGLSPRTPSLPSLSLKGPMREFFMGSVSQYIMKHCKTPVLIARNV